MCTGGGNIRVSRVATGIERAYLVSVSGIRNQARVVVGGDIRTSLSYFDKVRATCSLATFDLEAIFIVRTVSPAEINLSVGDNSCSQGGGRSWRRRWLCSIR